MRRYIVVIMTFLGIFSIYSNRVCLNVAIVAMTQKFNVTLENGTVIEDQHFDWDSKQRGLVLSSFYYGYIWTQIIGGVLASKFGGYYVFVFGVIGSCLMALITPVAASASIYLLVTVRIIEGLVEAVIMPSMHAILSRWAPVYERSRMASFCIMGCYGGTIVAMPVAGVIASNVGWQYIFYVFGGLGSIWCVFWVLFIRPIPDKDTFITDEEVTYIVKSIGNEAEERKKIIHPWKSILTSIAVWAIIISQFAENWSFITLLTQLPTFLSDVIGLNVQILGVVSAIPYLTRSCFLSIGGYLADWCQIKGYLTTRQVRRYFSCGGFVALCASVLLATFLDNSVAVVLFLTLTVAFGGIACIGHMINALDLAPNHASVIFGLSNSVATIGGITSPLLTGEIVTEGTKEQWQIVFLVIVGMNVIGCIFYWFFARGELQPWANSPVESRKSMQMENSEKNI
ncbi:sialin-like [Phlebotomus argentipes]|uniref:sialin-like n=1 Tax=Phlebotomus argentipes TaxID=94469 RepID=UPI002892BF62|nr:sialin-like [Phlebotomus argentipes]